MVGVNKNNVVNMAENEIQVGPTHPQDRKLASITESDDPNYEEYVPEPLMDIPSLPVGAPIETVIAALVNAVNCQVQYMREQNL
ncbi:hypothetical protein L195_g042473 [Trifolium pratense]|uniref:Uncharacterized protein n=1 Tax=Trifolium pratense TaxID=57577 RepID=A0A2K3M6J6_TRIPR|nr:hypothetical protein L195_g042473 [Trifolium pratense]